MSDILTKSRNLAVLIFALNCLSNPVAAENDDQKRLKFFESKIRPVLIEHCNECHSAGSDEVAGGLRVDFARGLVTGGDSGPALVAGKSKESLLLQAMQYTDLEMPPKGKLPEAVIRDFEKWIDDGAFDPRNSVPASSGKSPPKRIIDLEEGKKFWAFQPVQDFQAPDVKQKNWPSSHGGSNQIDRFLLSKMESEGLKPAVSADPATLLRRVYYDLIGLPPPPEKLLEFVANPSEAALIQTVDRLLASREFGEKWGRHWLDVARYADSNGGDFNATFHNAWRYRNYVIDAYNQDKPFDEFVREQIAGDLIAESQAESGSAEDANRRAQQVVATGFLMLGAKMLSERDKLKLTMDVVDEQINTVGQAFLGLTLGCARCHDHKFDPIPTHDYYALAGIFKSTRTLEGESQKYVSTWPRRELPTSAEHLAAVKKHQTAAKTLAEELKSAENKKSKLEKQLAKTQSRFREHLVDNTQAKLTGVWKPSTFFPRFVGKGYIHDEKSEKGEKFAEFPIQVKRTADYEVQVSYTPGNTRANNVPIVIKHAAGESEVKLDQQKNPSIEELYASVGRFRFRHDLDSSITITTVGTVGYVIVDAVRLIELDEKGKPIRDASVDMKAVEQLKGQLEQINLAIGELKKEQKQLDANAPPPIPKAIAVAEHKTIEDSNLYVRGEHRNPGPKIPKGVLQVIAGKDWRIRSPKRSGRLELANWLADQKNPLTARVYVNRIWGHLFGEGIVRSVDNFGQLGARPTHPQLLDHLTTEFLEQNGSTKKLIRKIVLSNAYRMSSRFDQHSWKVDADNRNLSRFHRRRLPAESIRDALLVISGQIDRTPGESPVEGLGTLVTQNNSEQKKFESKTSFKRSVYLPMIRAEIPEILTVFDMADSDLVTGKRAVTNVPAQSLLLLNSPLVMESAKRTAEDLVRKHDDPAEQIKAAYLRILSRHPQPNELETGLKFISSNRKTQASTSPSQTQTPKPSNSSQGLALFVQSLFASAEFRILN